MVKPALKDFWQVCQVLGNGVRMHMRGEVNVKIWMSLCIYDSMHVHIHMSVCLVCVRLQMWMQLINNLDFSDLLTRLQLMTDFQHCSTIFYSVDEWTELISRLWASLSHSFKSSDGTFRSLRWCSSVVHVHQNELVHWTSSFSSAVQFFLKNERKCWTIELAWTLN